MCKACKIIKTIILLAIGLYAALFAVFFFDLDGKLMYHVAEPLLVKHYDKMKRRDVTQKEYKI